LLIREGGRGRGVNYRHTPEALPILVFLEVIYKETNCRQPIIVNCIYKPEILS